MPSRLSALLCLQWVLQCVFCRDVTVPAGPLYRVAGFPLTLPCSVTGYEGPRMQNFEWFLYPEDSDSRQIGVISTQDRGFSYAPFQPRVRSGEVRVERDSGDRAALVVQRLRPEDQGRYECYTPSTDTRYYGNYSASVTIKVIPDTLQISHSHSLSRQPLIEGAELQLTCEAAVQSKEHTHLSVTFGVRGGAGSRAVTSGQGHNLREIISIGRELAVIPGRGGDYERRYQDGEISLEKRKGKSAGDRDLYVMKMAAVAPSDSGAYFCEATQWILDPDGSWSKLAHRTMELGDLTVRPLADTVTVSTTPSGAVNLPIGSPLRLTCEVSGVGAWNRSALLVRWTRRGGGEGTAVAPEVEVARMGPDGVTSWGDDASRGGGGAVEMEAQGRYSLRLFSAHPADSGTYRCIVSIFAGHRDPGPSSPASVTQRSGGVTVSFTAKEVRVAAAATLARGPLLKRGDTVTLLCNVTVTTAGPYQVEVQWFHKREEPGSSGEEPTGDGHAPLLAALTHEGLSRLHGNFGDVSVDQPEHGYYRLRIHGAQMQDQGYYTCQAEVWGQDPHGAWYSTGVAAKSTPVNVYLYSRAMDLLLIPLVVGVSSALFVGVVVAGTVTCCFMNRLARRRSQK
ncbi:immunoglobulin superfamily member 8 [Brienomyrus brachyistius]|uniref:immunoglobulin superfamily member 8 n=1 Tax=Brienomyrus brachyistius TaxID=42636 RepID=UPI0020B330C4|nr:immunoglobulin superfamily member 8 [Brienomyrus brachyistius]